MERTCKKCGGAVGEQDQYCIHCGTPLEKEPQREEELRTENGTELAKPLSVWAYLLMGLVFLIPLVNIIVPLIWIFRWGINPNYKNAAKAWFIMAAVSLLLGAAAFIGLIRFVQTIPFPEYHMEYYTPEREFWRNLPFELDEI